LALRWHLSCAPVSSRKHEDAGELKWSSYGWDCDGGGAPRKNNIGGGGKFGV
jgi:hypothetical protein